MKIVDQKLHSSSTTFFVVMLGVRRWHSCSSYFCSCCCSSYFYFFSSPVLSVVHCKHAKSGRPKDDGQRMRIQWWRVFLAAQHLSVRLLWAASVCVPQLRRMNTKPSTVHHAVGRRLRAWPAPRSNGVISIVVIVRCDGMHAKRDNPNYFHRTAVRNLSQRRK